MRIVWTGNGLPPIGTVCEIAASTEYLKIRYPEGSKVKIYANFTDDRGIELAAFVDEIGNIAGVCTAKCFRPFRTPEQIAAEERESGIEGIRKAVSSSTNCKAHGLDWDVAGAIYDAGYRKEVKS